MVSSAPLINQLISLVMVVVVVVVHENAWAKKLDKCLSKESIWPNDFIVIIAL